MAGEVLSAEHVLFESTNDAWLTDAVPTEFLMGGQWPRSGRRQTVFNTTAYFFETGNAGSWPCRPDVSHAFRLGSHACHSSPL